MSMMRSVGGTLIAEMPERKLGMISLMMMTIRVKRVASASTRWDMSACGSSTISNCLGMATEWIISDSADDLVAATVKTVTSKP